MSFDSLTCDECDLNYFTIPKLYFTTESGEIHTLMYPSGSALFKTASKAMSEKGNGSFSGLFCNDCHEVSDIADVDEKRCSQCKSSNLLSIRSLEGKSCPKCKVGSIVRHKPLFEI